MGVLDVVLVTGANGGLGREFVQQALDLGAGKVYATARSPLTWGDPRISPLTLDVTDPASIAEAAAHATDVTLVVNNAGAANGASVLGDQTSLRELFEVNLTRLAVRRGTWLRGYVYAFIEAFAPTLTRAVVERALNGEAIEG